MENLIRLSEDKLFQITGFRKGEIKFGERIQTVPQDLSVLECLQKSEAKFVLFGIPEDVGVKANFGRPGTASAFENTLQSLANIQHNRFAKGYDLLVLGHIDTTLWLQKAQSLNPQNKEELKELYKIVQQIDKEVAHLVSLIVKNNK